MRLRMVAAFSLVLLLTANVDAGQCTSSGRIASALDAHGLSFIAFPLPVPSPGGKMATGLYVDDRSFCSVDPCLDIGLVGDGTWVYLETNGVPGLQRGGHSSLPTTPLTGENDSEFAACDTPNPDELVF